MQSSSSIGDHLLFFQNILKNYLLIKWFILQYYLLIKWFAYIFIVCFTVCFMLISLFTMIFFYLLQKTQNSEVASETGLREREKRGRLQLMIFMLQEPFRTWLETLLKVGKWPIPGKKKRKKHRLQCFKYAPRVRYFGTGKGLSSFFTIRALKYTQKLFSYIIFHE